MDGSHPGSPQLISSFSFKPCCWNLMLSHTLIWTFDYEGRLIWFFDGNTLYHRGIRGEILTSYHTPDGQRHYSLLPPARHNSLYLQTIKALQQNLSLAPAPGQEIIQRSMNWLKEGRHKEKEWVEKIYPYPVAILPPDQYLSLVIQISEGCPWNQCTFCGFYRDRSFRVKPLEQIKKHIMEIKNFFGRGLSFRRSLFLGDANALSAPPDLLDAVFPLLQKNFPLQSARGIYSFSDIFLGKRKKEHHWKKWKNLGLRRVYVGVETGSDFLLQKIQKPQSAREIVTILRDIKKQGISLGIILLTGLGGKLYQQEHIKKTIQLVDELRLSQGDVIYLSDLLPYP
ncbi:MAG: radical SAM protein, partial [bacterium]